ncbi:MAG: hypothetical protein SVW57_05775 [Thermodesulfobacteriota bacterium]|nr:hypothetical protein [Thermodesulfobacteriota bacterium]
MGEIVKEGEEVVYKQNNGEITAWLTNFEEKMELSHEGEPLYKKLLYAMILIGVLYLAIIFLSL